MECNNLKPLSTCDKPVVRLMAAVLFRFFKFYFILFIQSVFRYERYLLIKRICVRCEMVTVDSGDDDISTVFMHICTGWPKK